MMSDILRAGRLDPDFIQAVRVTLIEASSALEAMQAKTLAGAPCPVSWANDLSGVEPGVTLIIGNEFFDCLPIRQFIQKDRFAGASGWHERMVTLEDGQLHYAVSPVAISKTLQATLPRAHGEAKNEDLLEICPAHTQMLDQVKTRFDDNLGRALFIDYGPAETEFGDTLQALKRHEKVGAFSDPGNTDLTARVDFGALVDMAHGIDLAVTSPIHQREFLSKLGIELRAVSLSRAKPDSKDKIGRQLHRLTGSDEMGDLFKAICFQSDGLMIPLGFRDIL